MVVLDCLRIKAPAEAEVCMRQLKVWLIDAGFVCAGIVT